MKDQYDVVWTVGPSVVMPCFVQRDGAYAGGDAAAAGRTLL